MNEVKFLLKFGQKKHIEEFANEGLFCSNAETFWGIENKLKLKGQGDPFGSEFNDIRSKDVNA